MNETPLDRARERILTRIIELQHHARQHADGLRYCLPDSAATEDAVSMREWESSCGGWEDYQYKCHHCGHAWWVEGIDA